MTISEWADAKRRLSSEASAEPGPWRTSRVPYLREPMDAISNPSVERVVCMWGSQLGKSDGNGVAEKAQTKAMTFVPRADTLQALLTMVGVRKV